MSSARRASLKAPPRGAARGIVLLVLLLMLALAGIGLMAAIDVWTIERQREREGQLLFVGEQYRKAIERYFLAAPRGGARALPPSIEMLLNDDRYPVPVHHLRRAYPDPITGSTEWGEVRVGDRLIGVFSLSDRQPLKVANFPPAYQAFNDAVAYHDWVFRYRLPGGRFSVPGLAPGSAAGPTDPTPPSTPRRRSPL
jgi:type II secretory pathway pseudopilin PulG